MKIRLSIAAASEPPTTFEHAGPVIRIGRDPDCELALQGEASSAVSRQHARIELGEAGATVADLGSSNGTLLNGHLLDGPAPLRVGDRIQMGYTGATLTLLDLDLAPPPAAKAAGVPRAVVIGAAAAAALALAAVAAVLLLRPSQPPEYAQAPSTEPQPSPQSSPTAKGPPPITPGPDTDKSPPPSKGTPSEEVKEVGTYVAPDQWVSVLVARQGESYPWAVLRPESKVNTSQTLVSLPGYRSLVALDSKLDLTLWGDLPEFSAFPPVLESVVMLHAPSAGADLDFTLDRGRVVVANRKAPAAPARVRLRFLREVWELELPANSEVAVESWGELWGPPQKGAGGGPASALTCLGVFTKGRARLTTPDRTFDLDNGSRVSCQYPEPARPSKAPIQALPAWWTSQPPQDATAVQKAQFSLLDWSRLLGGAGPATAAGKPPAPAGRKEPVVSTIRTQVLEVNDPDNQDVGVFFLGALDEVGPLVNCLMNRQTKQYNVRGAAVHALQAWLSRGKGHPDELAAILANQGLSPDKARQVVGLLHFFLPEARDRQQTYEELVKQLDDDELLLRVLAFWQVVQLGVAGRLPDEVKKIEYEPTWDAEKRRPAVQQWQKLLAAGKVPAPPRR